MRRASLIAIALVVTLLILQPGSTRSANAVMASSSNVALVPGPCGAFGGAGCMPTSGFSGGYAPSFTNVPTDDLPSVISNYDTVVLLQICDIGEYLDWDTWRDALNDWINAGGKLIIYDSDACGTKTLDYSLFVYPFTTNNPCQCGSNQGTIEDVEDNTLSSTDTSSPYYVDLIDIQNNTDAVGDASVMLTQDSHWKGDLKAKNVNNFEGFTHTYAEYGPGLIIYNGLDSDDIGFNANLAKLWELELKQQWDPSDLPGGVSVAVCPEDPVEIAIEKQWNLKTINVLGAWKQFRNCSPPTVRVAILDTGVNADHRDLNGRIAKQFWYFTNSGSDTNGHGTALAGIIGANRDNKLDVSGVHPYADIYTYKIVASDQGPAQQIRTYADAIRDAVDDGAQVINLSNGFLFDFQQLVKVGGVSAAVPCLLGCDADGLLAKAVKYAQDHNVIIVAASGNTGKTESKYPAAYAAKYWNVVAVAASTISGKSWTKNTTGPWVTLSAPGGVDPGIKSCELSRDDCVPILGLKSGTTEDIGTSYAAPQVTGVVALMIAIRPSLDRQHVRQLLRDSATAFSESPARPSGVGILNAAKAVSAARVD